MTEHNKKKPGFLEENNGTRSSMRLMSIISLGASIMFGVLTLGAESDTAKAGGNTDGLILTGMFLIGAFAPKAVQKFAENKIGPISSVSKKSDPQ